MTQLVSIIVPIYNVEKYLYKCLSSLVNQSYNNIEILLVDDGSTDNSYMICKEYCRKDSRIKIIQQENGGLSAARNTGIDHSQGDFLVFVDSDDYVEHDYVEKLYNYIITYNTDLVLCNLDYVDEKNEHVLKETYSLEKGCWGFDEFWKQYHSCNNVPVVVAWNKIYKRQLFDCLRYPVGKIHEDEFIIHHLVGEKTTVGVCPDLLYHYRQRSDSITGKKFNVKNLDSVEARLERSRIMRENKYYLWAEKSLNDVFLTLVKAGGILDFKDLYVKDRYKDLKKRYIIENMNLKKIKEYRSQNSLKKRLSIIIFTYNESLYFFLLGILKRIRNFFSKGAVSND